MTTWADETDVIVAGSGGGLVGAYTAAREGLSVMVVEASELFGGTTAYSGGGGMWFPCNPVLRRAGADDTLDDAFAYFHAAVGDRTPVELQRAYVYGGAELIAYLEDDERFEFDILPWPDYYGRLPHARIDGMRHTVMKPLPAQRLGELADRIRGPLDRERLGADVPKYLIGGRALIGRFLAAITSYPRASVNLNSPLVELVTSDGCVLGAVVEQDGRRRTIRARAGVLLAAGGFENNPALRQRFGVPGDARDTMGAPGNLGLALQAGIAAGAATDLMDQAWWSPGFSHPDGRSAFSLWFTGGIFVGQNGKRFVNESAPYDRIGKAIIDQISSGAMTLPFWMIYDDREGLVPPVKATNVSMVDPERYVDAGLWHTGDTLPELAAKIGVDADNLVETMKRYNEFVAAGVDDDFGRGDEAYDRAFSGGKSPMVSIDKAPYHAAAFGLSDLGTKGGLVTDSHARVLDTDGNPIRGLYAAGNTMAAVTGAVYPGGGIPIGASMLFSHLAALHMATHISPRRN
ncbi:succinate dehydrogenase/fumarate reductase flavoprotein subunit [Mycobacterium sp. JS623]|uniref:FAD-binding protein n=1 Tax=Mycobacterium sp. JS623 TaxID=212767 RepID=UPI0002A56EC2|nr:FAD-binding protein [Mycobacterium sp. JS623]AGB24431.1 succinate dehydrogenase/fumarate reductase flavoprotein subunit [Mycobacterium sp. JS623]